MHKRCMKGKKLKEILATDTTKDFESYFRSSGECKLNFSSQGKNVCNVQTFAYQYHRYSDMHLQITLLQELFSENY